MELSVVFVIDAAYSMDQTNCIIRFEKVCEENSISSSMRTFDSKTYRHDREIVSLPAFHFYNGNKLLYTMYDDPSYIENYILTHRNKRPTLIDRAIKLLRLKRIHPITLHNTH